MTRMRPGRAGDDVAGIGNVRDNDLAMRGDGCKTEEEWLRFLLVLIDSFFEEVIRHVRDEVGAVLVPVDLPLVIVVEEAGVPVVVAERVEQDLGASPTGGIRVVEVENSDLIQKLAGIVCVVTCFLEEDGKVLVVEAFSLPLWPSAYAQSLLVFCFNISTKGPLVCR